MGEGSEEAKAGESKQSSAIKIPGFAQATEKGQNPLEFSVLYIIQRQLPLFWQQFFE